MKNTIWILTAALAIISIVFAIMYFGTSGKLSSLQKEKEEIQNSLTLATQTITDIQSNLDELDSQLNINGEIPGTVTGDRRTRLINTINSMRAQIENDKKRIADLELRLSRSSTQLRGVQDMLDKLKRSVADKEKVVADLQNRLGILNETLETERITSRREIARRDQTISEKQSVIEEKDKDINTMYYIVGTRKELIDKKIVDRRGGLLGIGKVSTMTDQINLKEFYTLNLLETAQITFPATRKGYSILSSQNAASYRIDKDGDFYVLRVTDPQLFRNQKYIVIELL